MVEQHADNYLEQEREEPQPQSMEYLAKNYLVQELYNASSWEKFLKGMQ